MWNLYIEDDARHSAMSGHHEYDMRMRREILCFQTRYRPGIPTGAFPCPESDDLLSSAAPTLTRVSPKLPAILWERDAYLQNKARKVCFL